MIELIIGLLGVVILLFVLFVRAERKAVKEAERANQSEASINIAKNAAKKTEELIKKQEKEVENKTGIIRKRRYFGD